MNLGLTAEARAFRRAVGSTAWAVLEDLVLDADVDERGALVAHTNVRRLAAQVGVSKDTAARAVTRLALAGVVHRVVAERGTRGALPSSSYVLDLVGIAGLTFDASHGSAVLHADTNAPAQASPRTRTRPASRVDDAQTSLFDLPASVS